MKIKTIRWRLDAAEKFDEAVNAALEEGWMLTKREVLDGRQLGSDTYQHRMLYAELILPDAPAEPEKPADLDAAMDLIKDECSQHQSCYDCPLHDRCDCEPPSVWDVPEERRVRQ